MDKPAPRMPRGSRRWLPDHPD